ncbi:uncharacterized protein LOC121388518 [Gigantopelta aegis]|uniref:uncharacterized protein LOC121388518 n=1 Tax=Gigantopelta aegis TaxID=1735272 RepID=UPI001B88B8E6|nr:uncharacterized protein LOC121388518 [Gigantopelta aegis]
MTCSSSPECTLVEFFRHENQACPPSLSNNGGIRISTNSDLVICLEDISNAAPTAPSSTCIILDGTVIVQLLSPATAKTFDDYAKHIFIPYICTKFETVSRLDLVWDRYITDSLKGSARTKRGKGIRRCVVAAAAIPGNWQNFLRVDTRHGHHKILIRTVDTDGVVLAVQKLQSDDELWLAFGTGKNFRHLAAHIFAAGIGEEKARALPMFHALTGYDTVSCFAGHGKKTAWSSSHQSQSQLQGTARQSQLQGTVHQSQLQGTVHQSQLQGTAHQRHGALYGSQGTPACKPDKNELSSLTMRWDAFRMDSLAKGISKVNTNTGSKSNARNPALYKTGILPWQSFIQMAPDYTFLEKEVRIVMIGITGSGKSSSGNSILGTKRFHSECSATSVTAACQQGSATRFGYRINIIDTPGLLDTGRSQAEITKEILKCIGISSPGPHAFILVLKIKRFTKEENDTITYFREVFGDGMLNYLFVLFTGMDDLEHDGQTLEQYLAKAPENLKTLLKECGQKYFGINNRQTDKKRMEKEMYDLISKIKSNVSKNGGKHYTSDLLKAAEEQMRKREQEILEQKDEEIRKKEEQIMKKFEAKQAKVDEKYREENERMQRELALIERQNKAQMEALNEKQTREAAEAKARQDEYIAKLENLEKEGELQQAEMEKQRLQVELERERAEREEARKLIQQEKDKRIELELKRMEDNMARAEEERKRREEEFESLRRKREMEALIDAREKARQETETGGGVLGYLWNSAKYWLGY